MQLPEITSSSDCFWTFRPSFPMPVNKLAIVYLLVSTSIPGFFKRMLLLLDFSLWRS